MRKLLLLSLDDLLVVTREFINQDVSRSGLDRCLRRHGVSRLADLKPKPEKARFKTFKDYEPGYVHVDIKYLPQMPDQNHRSYLFVAIDRATRWVYVQIKQSKSTASAKAFLNQVIKQAPFNIKTLLTDNVKVNSRQRREGALGYKAFTDRVTARGSRTPTGDHLFDQLCAAHAIDHRLIPIRRPQTNGMVERFNGRITEVLATTRFKSGENLSETLRLYVYLYNQQIPQQVLGHHPPIHALKEWQNTHLHLFNKQAKNRPGSDT